MVEFSARTACSATTRGLAGCSSAMTIRKNSGTEPLVSELSCCAIGFSPPGTDVESASYQLKQSEPLIDEKCIRILVVPQEIRTPERMDSPEHHHDNSLQLI